MSERLDPRLIFELIAAQVPADLHPHVLVVGSLAAARHHREQLHQDSVSTKDADVVVQPAGALDECRTIAARLLDAGWMRHEKCFASPLGTPADQLRAIRLHPPGTKLYFVELLAFPSSVQTAAKAWTALELDDGLYGLPSFRFMGVTGVEAIRSPEGILYARPAMMALSNLLSHPRVGTDTMSEPIGQRILRRSAKDLGRVLGLARLADRQETEDWAALWERALRDCFADDAPGLAARLGSGLREILDDPDFLDEARHALDTGLLSGFRLTSENLVAVGEQLLDDVIEPVRNAFASQT